MPKRLPLRWRDESIREFQASARLRYYEGLFLAGGGHRTGAIYLWGYAAEMTLKAAYFRLLGRPETAVLTWPADILPAIHHGRTTLGIAWPIPHQGHNVRAWADLLVLRRAATPGVAYGTAFSRRVQDAGQRIGELWSETLRYHKNLAYPHELRQVQDSVEWLLTNSHAL